MVCLLASACDRVCCDGSVCHCVVNFLRTVLFFTPPETRTFVPSQSSRSWR